MKPRAFLSDFGDIVLKGLMLNSFNLLFAKGNTLQTLLVRAVRAFGSGENLFRFWLLLDLFLHLFFFLWSVFAIYRLLE